MKLALCLSGQPRSYFSAYEYIKKNLLDLHEVDVFVHYWKSTNDLVNIKIWEEINQLYEPQYCVFDRTLSRDINSDMIVPNASHPASFCTSMFFSIFQANNFRIRNELTKNIKYDYVIRSRFDLALNTEIPFESLKKGVVYVSRDTDGPNPLLNDQFAVSDPETMNYYASTFLNLRKHYNDGVPLCGHSMLEANLNLYNVKVNRLELNHPFSDGKYNIGRHSLIRDDMNQWVDDKIWGY
jgi:hypothetical protein